jgi:hypothetical protein
MTAPAPATSTENRLPGEAGTGVPDGPSRDGFEAKEPERSPAQTSIDQLSASRPASRAQVMVTQTPAPGLQGGTPLFKSHPDGAAPSGAGPAAERTEVGR